VTEQFPGPDLLDVSDAIGELARARRERVIEAVPSPQPPWLESIDAGEITYIFRARALPFRQMDPQAFTQALREAYGLTLGRLDLSPLLTQIPREELARLSEREMLEHLVRTEGGQLTLTNGKFTQRNDFYAINIVNIDFESIQVQVAGPTVVAEAVAQDVAEMVWAAVGVTKQWPAIESNLMLIGYGTSTRVNLPGGSHLLLNPGLWAFLQGNLNEGPAFAKDLAATPAPAPGAAQTDQVVGVPTLDSVEIRIGILNLTTGSEEPASLEFDVRARSDHGSGRVRVTTQLAYERHVELLGALVEALGGPLER
jgi:hypothetical protein